MKKAKEIYFDLSSLRPLTASVVHVENDVPVLELDHDDTRCLHSCVQDILK
jgi:hypothetical protein